MPPYDGLIGGNRIEPRPSLGSIGLEGIARNNLLRLSVQSACVSERQWLQIGFEPVGTCAVATEGLSSPVIEWKLFVQQNRKGVDELFEFLSGRIRLNGMVHDAYPELRQCFIVRATCSFGARILPYPTR